MRRAVITSVLFWCVASACLAQGPAFTPKADLSDTYGGLALTWTVAQFTAANAAGTGPATIEFGLNVPAGYIPGTIEPVPLVLYLHGAGARGSNLMSVLQRQTPRHFALQSQTIADYQAFVAAPVTTIFLIENNGNDSGYFQALDIDGNPTGPQVPFTKDVDYLKTDYKFFLNQRASGIMFVAPYPIYGIRIIKPDAGALGFDGLSISGVPAPIPTP